MKLMGRRKLWVVSALLRASVGLCVAGGLTSQDQTGAQQPSAQEKTGAAPKAKAGTKQAVEARLKAVEKPKADSAIHEVEKTLFATHQFGQAVISPDGEAGGLGGDVDWEGWGDFGEDRDLRFGD